MGADGHIKIWRDETVRAEFQDCDELFYSLPNHYTDELDGVKYHHCYWGDNMYVSWRDESDWYVEPHEPTTDDEEALRESRLARLREFVAWLDKNGTWWEVWT